MSFAKWQPFGLVLNVVEREGNDRDDHASPWTFVSEIYSSTSMQEQ